MQFIQWTEEKIRRTADRTTSNNKLIIYNLPPPPCPHVVRYRVTGTCRLKTFQIINSVLNSFKEKCINLRSIRQTSD